MNAVDLNYLLGMAGTVAFAVTAVLAVTPKGIDLFGAAVLGVITAIGGGTIRDLILGVPVFWSTDLNYIWVALAASALAFYAPRLVKQRHVYGALLYIDGLGAALFGIQATHKVLLLDFAWPLGPVILGILTAIGGGLIRDVLADNTTLLMKPDLYAIPIAIGCSLYVLLYERVDPVALGLLCTLIIFGIRAAAIHWDLKVPGWMLARSKEST